MNRIRPYKFVALLSGIIILFFLVLERRHPYFFLQDDNRTYNLPNLVHNFRSLFGQGEFPLYNFHQYLGLPHFALGQPASAYPLGYLAVYLSTILLGNPTGTLEFLVIMHLMIASAGFFYLCQELDLSPEVSILGSLGWALNSFVVYASNSWWQVSAAAAYLPWIFLSQILFQRRLSYGAFVQLVFVRALFFYVGHIQLFIYVCVFEVLAFGLIRVFARDHVATATPARNAWGLYAASFMGTFLLSLPLLLPMWRQMLLSAHRAAQMGYSAFASQSFDIGCWVLSLVYPFLDGAPLNPVPVRHLENLGHIGYVALFFSGYALFRMVRPSTTGRTWVTPVVWAAVVLGAVGVLWGAGFLNRIIYEIPILNRFRWHFKLALFAHFFLILLSCFGMQLMMTRFRGRDAHRAVFLGMALVLFLNYSVLYNFGPLRSFNAIPHSDTLPLAEPMQQELSSGRILPIGYRFEDPYTATALGFNYATLWGLYQVGGYEPLVGGANHEAALRLEFISTYIGDEIPIGYLRDIGVKWYILSRTAVRKELTEAYASALKALRMEEVLTEDTRRIFQDPEAKPLIYFEDDPLTQPPSRLGVNTIDLSYTRQNHGTLIVNFLYNKNFRVQIDDQPAIPLAGKDGERIRVDAPDGTHILRLGYHDPDLFRGLWATAGTFLFFAGFPLRNALRFRRQIHLVPLPYVSSCEESHTEGAPPVEISAQDVDEHLPRHWT